MPAEFRDAYFAGRTRAWFLGDYGTPDETTAEWQNRIEGDPVGTDFMHFAACYHLAGKKAEALDLLQASNHSEETYARLAVAQLMADDPLLHDKIESICRAIAAEDESPSVRMLAIEILVRVGRKDVARDIASNAPSSQSPQYKAIFPYLHDGSTDELYNGVKLGAPDSATLIWAFNPDYLLGLDAQVVGEHEAARMRFRRCVSSRMFMSTWYWWAKVYLNQLESVHADHDSRKE